jgi:hypothetical protein
MRRIFLAFTLSAVACIFQPSSARADDNAKQAPLAEEVKAARAEIDSVLGEMRATSRRVRDQLRATRLRGTREQITCVDEALSRADVSVRTAKDNADLALRAYAENDVDTARDALRKMKEWRQAQRIAAKDGASCSVGAITVRSGTTVTMSVDPSIPRVAP